MLVPSQPPRSLAALMGISGAKVNLVALAEEVQLTLLPKDEAMNQLAASGLSRLARFRDPPWTDRL